MTMHLGRHKQFETSTLVPSGFNFFLLLAFSFLQPDSQISLLILSTLFIQTTFGEISPPSQTQSQILPSGAGILARFSVAALEESLQVGNKPS